MNLSIESVTRFSVTHKIYVKHFLKFLLEKAVYLFACVCILLIAIDSVTEITFAIMFSQNILDLLVRQLSWIPELFLMSRLF